MGDFRDTDRFESTPEENKKRERQIIRRQEMPEVMRQLLVRIHINGLLPELAEEVKAVLDEINVVGLSSVLPDDCGK